MSETERVRYDLMLFINTPTFAVICNSIVWAVLLCVSAHRHRIPFLGIQPSNVPSSGSLEQNLSSLVFGFPMSENQFQFLQRSELAESQSQVQGEDRLIDPRSTKLMKLKAARRTEDQETLGNEGVLHTVPLLTDE